MREQTSSFEVARTVRELTEMVGSRVRKAYQPHYEQVVLRMSKKGFPNRDLVIVRGKRVYYSSRDRPMPPNPSQFAMVLRKHLGNSRFIGVSQSGFDRVMSLEFEHGRGKMSLVIELFRDGNVLLLDEDGVIIQPLTHATYASRTLKKGVPYVPPPPSLDPRTLDRDKLDEILEGSDSDLIRTVASRLNIGRVYGSAVCSKAGLAEEQLASSLDKGEREILLSSVLSMMDELEKGDRCILWVDDATSLEKWQSLQENIGDESPGGAVLVSPIWLDNMEDSPFIELESLSNALDGVFGEHDSAAFIRREEEKLVEEGTSQKQSQAKLERRATQQKRAIDGFLQKAVISQELGKSIQENWEHVNSIIMQFNKAISESNWQEVSDMSQEVGWIGGVDAKKRTIVAYLPDGDGEPGTSVTLEVDKTVHQNAQRYFETGRIQKDKAAGAEIALKKTIETQTREEKKAAKDAAGGRLRSIKRSRRFWFEKHRWAILSDGRMIVGGRDAKGNDAIVKKHLGSKDLYIHADLHGAPSCALKVREGIELRESPSDNVPDGVCSLQITQNLEGPEEGRDLPDSILREASQIAVCWSRAWGSGGAAATAFYVRPSQVSKTTESGESLGRGSFVVRGQRHWYRDLSLEIGIGMGVVNGVPLPVIGTADTISKSFGRWARITPGREKKENVANSISKATGLSQDDVLSSLPPGGCSIEDHGLLRR
tara:strand:- start:9499 stop:11634 length:2136 start_codon:yes stop_codon:yes gene_type:complete